MSIDLIRSAHALLLVGALFVVGCGDDGPKSAAKKDSAATAKSAGGGDTSESAEAAPAAPGATAFAAGTPVVDSTARFSFALAPKKGDRFTYRLRSDNETDLGGKKMTESSTYNFTITVTGINDDGSLTLEMRHDSIRVRRAYAAGLVDSIARTIAFDTRRPDTAMRGSEQYTALIGRRVNVTLSKGGEVREVSNVEPILNAMFGKVKDRIPPKEWAQLGAVIKVQAYSSLLEQLFLKEAPDSSVAPGRQWQRTYDVPAMGVPSKNTVRYKLAEVRQVGGRPLGRVVMDLTTQFKTKKIDNEIVTANIDEMKADGSGEAVVQLDNGWPVRKATTIDMRMKMTGTLKAGPEKGKTNTVAQSVSTRLTLDLVGFTAGT
jgi:hypothetical protein